VSAPRLPEIPEAGATGAIAETYADLRRVIGVPFVATVYRVLAVKPGLLDRLWKELRPNLLQPATRTAAEGLTSTGGARVEPLPASALAVTSFDPELTAMTLAAYRRVNSINPIAFAALLDGVPGRGSPTEPRDAHSEPAILPMPDLASLDTRTVALLEEMSEAVSGDTRPLLVPGLLRHFSSDAALLAMVWTALRPALREIDLEAEADAVWDRGRRAAEDFPLPVTRLEDEWARGIIERFARVFPKMLRIGEMLEAALAEVLPTRHERH
jgi:hypothetical protein